MPHQGDGLGRRTFLGLSSGAVLAALAGSALADGTEAIDDGSIDTDLGGLQGVRLDVIGRYESGLFDEGGAEIVDHHPPTQRLFVVNADLGGVDVLDVADPTTPEKIGEIDATAAFSSAGSANSVAVGTDLVAVAVANEDPQRRGRVAFYDPESLDLLGTATVGALPDLVTFTPDETYALVANEAEPSPDYETDPRGSVSVIDVSDGASDPDVRTAGFTAYDGREEELREQGIRIFGPDASASQDFEPEYVTVAADSTTAWVSLQENNALAVLDVEAAEITDLLPLGYKDYSLPGNELDASDEDGGVNVRNWPIHGILQPDAIASYTLYDEAYILTANEGDSRDYEAFSEEAEVQDLELDPEAFDFENVVGIDSVSDLQKPENLGRLTVTTTLGDTDDDGQYEEIYAYGGRSFSVFDSEGTLLFDSGNDFEVITAERYPEQFNNDNAESDPDGRSNDKGPEPEGIALGQVGDRYFAFIGLERIGGLMIYDVTNPESPTFVQYINGRDFSVDIEGIAAGDADASAAGDLGPEGVAFVAAEDSPIENALAVVGHEISGTTTIYEVKPVPERA